MKIQNNVSFGSVWTHSTLRSSEEKIIGSFVDKNKKSLERITRGRAVIVFPSNEEGKFYLYSTSEKQTKINKHQKPAEDINVYKLIRFFERKIEKQNPKVAKFDIGNDEKTILNAFRTVSHAIVNPEAMKRFDRMQISEFKNIIKNFSKKILGNYLIYLNKK